MASVAGDVESGTQELLVDAWLTGIDRSLERFARIQFGRIPAERVAARFWETHGSRVVGSLHEMVGAYRDMRDLYSESVKEADRSLREGPEPLGRLTEESEAPRRVLQPIP